MNTPKSVGIRKPLHVGIIGCSAEGAALCYRTICSEGSAILGPHAHPEVSMHTPSLSDYVDYLERNDIEGVGRLILDSAEKLARIGADFLVCPDNTIHQAFDFVQPKSPLPWLHIAEVVASAAASRGYKRVGLLGTQWLVDSAVYPQKLEERGLQWARPGPEDRQQVGRIIMDELVYGVMKPESTIRLLSVIQRLAESGCDSIALACTELPLVIDDRNSPLPTLDSTRLLARAALRMAIDPSTPASSSPQTPADLRHSPRNPSTP